jgi:hypothetical protein
MIRRKPPAWLPATRATVAMLREQAARAETGQIGETMIATKPRKPAGRHGTFSRNGEAEHSADAERKARVGK